MEPNGFGQLGNEGKLGIFANCLFGNDTIGLGYQLENQIRAAIGTKQFYIGMFAVNLKVSGSHHETFDPSAPPVELPADTPAELPALAPPTFSGTSNSPRSFRSARVFPGHGSNRSSPLHAPPISAVLNHTKVKQRHRFRLKSLESHHHPICLSDLHPETMKGSVPSHPLEGVLRVLIARGCSRCQRTSRADASSADHHYETWP